MSAMPGRGSGSPRDEYGDLIPYRDVELAETPREHVQRMLQPYVPGSLERAVKEFATTVADEQFEREHQNCEASWRCLGCERQVCPRCEPSPGEPNTCPECWWTEDPEAA